MSEHESPECFICTGSIPAPRRSACKCTDRYVHDACLSKMLETATVARCPVCLEPYGNVTSKLCVVSVKLWSAGVCTCMMILVAMILLGCAINTYIALNSGRKLSHRDIGVAYGAAVMMTVVSAGLVGFVTHTVVVRGVKKLVKTAIKQKLVARVVPTPIDRALPLEVTLSSRFEGIELGLAGA